MNIKLFTVNTDSPNCHSLSRAAGTQKPAPEKVTGDFDKVTFHQTQSPANDTDFARILARETARTLKTSASEERVLNLQQQVASGTYKPDAKQIAEHILGYR